ncbi:MAG: coproporphyrinogen-III oxidase family protein [Candidatus Hinthialibacter antarcticus]|nr:coproporphyrinogen-III oxidase family protein [Candidatus Hinthialibacter antarcticus]
MSTQSEKKTTAGSYFVSNYPPFSVWKPDYVSSAFESIERQPHPEANLGIYLHIPFCRKRCHFCYFRVYTDKNSSEIRRYLDALTREFELYADKPIIGGRKPKYIYFGGGTPSFLSPHQLTGLVETMQKKLPWDAAEEITFECEPGTLTEAKLEAIRSIGVTRLSLGVEHFDDQVLELNNRAHRSGEIGRAYDFARSIEFPQINIDLIAGMLGETDEKWLDAVRKALAMQPDSLTVYQMEIPFNTTIYRDMMKEKGTEIAPVADWQTKRRWVKEAFAIFEEAGYTVTSAYTAVKNPESTKFIYRDMLWSGADMLGLGVSSFGHYGGVHAQNEKDMGPYLEKVEAGELPINRAKPLTDDERLIREFALQHKLGRVPRAYFQEKFDVDVFERFAGPLQELKNDGVLDYDDEAIHLTRDGLLRIDEGLKKYFLPEHQEVRYT